MCIYHETWRFSFARVVHLQTEQYLGYAVWMSDNFDNVIDWQEAVALNLSVDIFALGAVGEQLDEVGVVQQQTIGVQPISLWPHHFHKVLERSRIVEED